MNRSGCGFVILALVFTVTTTSTNNLCLNETEPLWFVKRLGAGGVCELCDEGYQFRKNGSATASCVLCPVDGDQPGNTFSNYCDSHDLDDGICNQVNFKNNYLENIDGSGSINLETDDYYEKCISGLETELSSVCGGDQNQTIIGNNCICTGPNMNRKQPGCSNDVDCSTQADVQRCNVYNCLSGYHAGPSSDEVFTCEQTICQDMPHCATPDDGECIDVSGTAVQPCLVCADGYDKNDAGICACDTGFQMDGAGRCSSCTTGYYGRLGTDGNLICNQCPVSSPDHSTHCTSVCTERMEETSNNVTFCINCCAADCSPSNWMNTIDCVPNTGR